MLAADWSERRDALKRARIRLMSATVISSSDSESIISSGCVVRKWVLVSDGWRDEDRNGLARRMSCTILVGVFLL